MYEKISEIIENKTLLKERLDFVALFLRKRNI